MKTCIWCSKGEPVVTFIKEAHTFPKSLGGDSVCDNVCDSCNHYFGSPTSKSPAIEVVLKEILNISKYLLLTTTNETPKNKRYKSEYFNINWNTKAISLKPKYKLQRSYQEKLGRLFKRGMYKVFLEERERQKKDAHNSRYDFIRKFARYNLDDYPVYLFKPKFQALIFATPDVIKPMIRFTEHSDSLDINFRVFEYQLMGHFFCIPTTPIFDLSIDSYRKHIRQTNHPMGLEIIPITYAEDIDYTFKGLNL